MKVAILGPEGTYTHQAAEEYFENYEPVFCSSIKEAIEADTEATVVPFENSLAGGVGKSIDLLREKDVEVTGEHLVEINHALLSNEDDVSNIEKIKSHPQALGQCREIIEKNGWEEVETSSTAKAAQEVEKGEAAIASELAGELNDLNKLETEIQDENSNTTRFLILGDGEVKEGEKTSVVIEPSEDYPGLLHSMLSCFSGHGINLSYIQSRPTQDGIGHYYFYLEAEADQGSEGFRKAAKCLETYSEVDILGSYNRG